MTLFLNLFACGVAGLAIFLAAQSARSMPRRVSAGDNQLRMLIRGESSPAVVFDSFGPVNLEIWNRVQPGVARFTRTVSYDHGGYWGSQPGPKPRDARRITQELHAALQNAGVAPPYLLVGYSFGGPYARVYAGTYPQEVAGLVLIDPTQEEFMAWLKKNYPDMTRVSEKHLAAQDELGSHQLSLDQAHEALLPHVPITLITGMKPQDLFTRHVLPRWLESHRTWLRPFPQARHIVTTNSGHEVVLSDPPLVIQAIREMVEDLRKANQ